MAKKFVISLCLVTLVININSWAINNASIVNNKTEAITVLETLDIIRNTNSKWESSSFITRRNILEMIYIIKSASREFVINPQYRSVEELSELKQEDIYSEHKVYIDVEVGSYDDFLITSAECYGLFNGEESSDGYLARLDSYATYGEALFFVGYLFYNTAYGLTIDEYYNIAEDMGLINSKNTIDILSIKVNTNCLNERISAYDFFNLLYRAMYIPNSEISDWGSELDSFYINRFSKKYVKCSEMENISG